MPGLKQRLRMPEHGKRLHARSLLVQIASYRDPELGPTVKDLIAKARFPKRLHIGICVQSFPDDPLELGPEILSSLGTLRGAKLTVDAVDARDSKGACWARARTQKLWEGETFTLQIDSHTRFEKAWDHDLFEMWDSCGDPKAVISGYPNAYTPPSDCDKSSVSLMASKEFSDAGIFSLTGLPVFPYPHLAPKTPYPSAFVTANLLFGPSSIITDVPYDPQIYFYGEEQSLSLRFWTHGYNVYNPNKPVLFHMYKEPDIQYTSHWGDNHDWQELDSIAQQRVNALFRGEGLEHPYGLGQVRTREAWEEWSGIYLTERIIRLNGQTGRFERCAASLNSVVD